MITIFDIRDIPPAQPEVARVSRWPRGSKRTILSTSSIQLWLG